MVWTPNMRHYSIFVQGTYIHRLPYCCKTSRDLWTISSYPKIIRDNQLVVGNIDFRYNTYQYNISAEIGLRSPSIESSGVLYISPTHTSSMQELIMQGLQQKLEKSCFRCNKNTWHVESNHILQPPNYLIIVVNRFRYINNQFAKDMCSIPMDMTVVLGYHKFSLQAAIDHHGPSIYSGHYTTSVNCCNRTFYCNDNKITEFDMINTKNSSTAYVVIYKLIT